MEANIGLLDKKIRLIVGGILLFLAVFFKLYLLAILGAYSLLTGYFDWCPIYSILGRDSLKWGINKNEPPSDTGVNE